MQNKYRLSGSIYERENEEEKIEPQKIIFLSVEGNATEKEYFEGVSINRKQLGINNKIDVEVLKRSKKDTNSAPQQVIELLEEYLRLRELGRENMIEEIPKEFVERYGIEFIQSFLDDENTIPLKRKNEFVTELMKIGYDVSYRKYINTYRKDLDEFAILIDRDIHSHSEANMLDCIRYCVENGYKCYISNPCFEFWLLLHLSDVQEEYADRMNLIKTNPKISSSHTFVSKEVSEKAHHGKSGIKFNKNYLPNIELAIERAKSFESDEEKLVYNVGCNVWRLLEEMKEFGM